MVPKLKGELRPPPPPWSRALASGALGALLHHRLNKEGVHGRRREAVGGVLPVHILQCGTHPGGVGGHTVHIGLLATCHHGHPQAGGLRRHLAGACQACAPARRYRTPAALPPPPPRPVTRGGLGTLSPLPCLCPWLCLARRPQVALQGFHPGARRSRSLVTSANRDSAARLSSLALDTRASRSWLAASALIARASHAPARCSCC